MLKTEAKRKINQEISTTRLSHGFQAKKIKKISPGDDDDDRLK